MMRGRDSDCENLSAQSRRTAGTSIGWMPICNSGVNSSLSGPAISAHPTLFTVPRLSGLTGGATLLRRQGLSSRLTVEPAQPSKCDGRRVPTTFDGGLAICNLACGIIDHALSLLVEIARSLG